MNSENKKKDEKYFLSNDYQKEFWNHNKNKRAFDHPVVTTFVNQRLDFLKKNLDFAQINTAFDVGCGDGFATYHMLKLVDDIEGGDIAEYMLENNPHDKAKLSVIDAQDMHNIKSNKYDLSYTWEVLHHVDSPLDAVKEMARISKKYVVIFEPNRSNPLQFGFGLLNKQERGTLRSTKGYLVKLCEDAGLKVLKAQYCGKIPPNKTPESMLGVMKKLPFESNVISGISIAIIAKKQ